MNHDNDPTTKVASNQAFDTRTLRAYLVDFVPLDGDFSVRQFKGGQSNPTFLIQAGKNKYVLRRKPAGAVLPSAHAIDREYRVLKALRETDVPVAKAHCYCEDVSVIGSPFYVMEHVQGRIFWEQSLPQLSTGERAAIYDEMNRVIAALHGLDPKRIGLDDYGRRGNYLERQISRWTQQYRASETGRIAAMEELIAWLPGHIPAVEETRLVHGDYRIDNLIFDPHRPQVVAVLDWELSTLGDPLADFAYHCMSWHIAPALFRGIADLDLDSLGIPPEASYVQAYSRRTGRPVPAPADWRFYIAFNLFRLAAILQGIMARSLQGNASSPEAAENGAKAGAIATLGWEIASSLDP